MNCQDLARLCRSSPVVVRRRDDDKTTDRRTRGRLVVKGQFLLQTDDPIVNLRDDVPSVNQDAFWTSREDRHDAFPRGCPEDLRLRGPATLTSCRRHGSVAL